MKNVLLLIHDDTGQEARLQAALDVTRALRGHLTCLDVTTVAPFIGDSSGVSGGAILLELERASEAANKARLTPRIAAEDVPWDWIDTTDYLEPALEAASAMADLIVVNRALDALPLPDMRAVASSLVLNSGKPILAVPDEARGFSAAGEALIAWDGSREAADPLAAAVPLLLLAGSVTILEVEDGTIARPAEEAAAYLSRHDIHANVLRMRTGPAADTLAYAAAGGRYDYLVMGAFGHSRLAEALFGGVTRRLLSDSPIPILLAH